MQPLAHPIPSASTTSAPKNIRFGTQDICLTQLQHTIAYARALQHWANEVHPPVPSQPHHLVRSGTGTPVGKGATHHFHRGRCLHDHSADPLDGNNLTTVNGGHAARVPKELHPKQQSPPKGIPVCDMQWRLACCYSNAGHTKVEAPISPPWGFMPYQPIPDSKPLCLPPSFTEVYKTLRQEESMEGAPLPVITSSLSEEALDSYEVMGWLWWWPGCFDTKPPEKC